VRSRAFLVLWIIQLIAAAALAQEATTAPTVPPVRITTRVEPQTVTIGSPFRYTMRIEADPEVEAIVPILTERLGEFLITDFGEVPQGSRKDGFVVERWYTLVTYETGDQLVPGPTVQYRTPGRELRSMDAPDTLVIVRSVLGADAEGADVRDIKPPVEVPRDYRPLWWGGAVLLLLGLLGVGLYWILNRKRGEGVEPLRPADEVAQEAFLRLRAARLIEKGRYEEYYVRLSAIVRRYLEGRFGLKAPEMTTEEFLQIAQRNPTLAAAQRSSLGHFLSEADLVKFARHVPTDEDAERAYSAARQFVETTRVEREAQCAAA
jgi:hypothetical protein